MLAKKSLRHLAVAASCAVLGARLAVAAEPTPAVPAALGDKPANTLSAEETAAGWKLLFDGKSTTGWHTYRRTDVRAGWQVKDGTLACVDPANAGDLCTDAQYGAFELSVDYNISKEGNSGVIYHATTKAGSAWQTGPEVQLRDNEDKLHDPELTGWLYALYKPPVDPKTEKPLDATRPAGQWNQLRLLITPEKCEHSINGVKYFEYVIGSEDFKQHVAKSKFATMADFAKSDTGFIALQGDHGQVSFRNIKVRLIEPKK